MSDSQIKISISNLVVLSTRENLQLYIDATVQARKCDRKNKTQQGQSENRIEGEDQQIKCTNVGQP